MLRGEEKPAAAPKMPLESEVTLETLQRLQDWYLSACDGHWEHDYGVKIDTLDNPGWSVTIDLVGTGLEVREFTPVTYGLDENAQPDSDDWLVCQVAERQFRAFGGPGKLDEILHTFLDWAEDDAE